MVLIRSKDFHTETLTRIKDFRQAGSLCDVTLTVGQDQIQAHRNVLAARSEYFRTLFLGQFKEAAMQSIDLTEVANNGTDLEQAIDFLYTGEIDINDDNLEALVKMSTYLLIESLRKICEEFMRERSSIRTCLDQFFCSVEYSLDETEKETKIMVMSRFHDFFIHDDNLHLTPDEVKVLLSKGMFQHCTASGIIQFLSKWLTDETTDQHVSVASQILDTVGNKVTESRTEQQKSKDLIIKIVKKLHNKTSSHVKRFLLKFQKFSSEIFHELEGTRFNGGLRIRSANIDSSSYEEVIITLSPKECVVNEFNERFPCKPAHGKPTFTEPIFTLCCYVPSTKSWHHIQDLKTIEAVADLPQQFRQGWKIASVLYKGELFLIRGIVCEKVYFYNLRDKVWRIMPLPDFDRENDDNYTFTVVHDYCLINENGCLYLILKMVEQDDNNGNGDVEVRGEFFVGYRLNEEGGNINATQIFETEMERRRDISGIYNEMQAKVSSVSNELIFTSGPQPSTADTERSAKGYSYVFIVNLSEQQPEAVNLSKEFNIAPKKGLTGVQILATSTHFYIVHDGTVESRYNDVRVLYEYKFHSKRLTKPQKDTKTAKLDMGKPLRKTKLPAKKTQAQGDLKTCLKINHHKGEVDMFPCCEQFTASNRNTFWSFEGDRHYFSALHDVQIDEDGQLTHREHKPPPFSAVTCMTVGELSADLVAQLARNPPGRFYRNVNTL